MPSLNEVLERQLQNPEIRDNRERTALARVVANGVISYRTEQRMSQRALAEKLGMEAVAGGAPGARGAQPGMETMTHLAQRLGMRFRIEIGPAIGRGHGHRRDAVEEITTSEGGLTRVRAGQVDRGV